MRTHDVKLLPPFFDAVLSGQKTFEIRLNDRDYQEGDLLYLREYSKRDSKYTGRVLSAEIGFVYKGFEYGLKEGYCVFSLLKVQEETEHADSVL